MAATITATLSSATANSYVTLAEANDYFETVPDSSTWTNKTDDQKNRSLIAATRWIDTLSYYGSRCDNGQALKFPRNNYTIDNVELTCTTIPNNIKYAQYGNLSEVKLGDIHVKYNTTSQGVGTVNNVMDKYPWLQSYLGAYMLGGSGTYQTRVVRG